MKKFLLLALALFMISESYAQGPFVPITRPLPLGFSTTLTLDDTLSIQNAATAESTLAYIYAAFPSTGRSMSWGHIALYVTAPTDTAEITISAWPCRATGWAYNATTLKPEVTLSPEQIYSTTASDSIVLANSIELNPNVEIMIPFEVRASGLTKLGPCDGYQIRWWWEDGGDAETLDSTFTFRVLAQ
jgi:hypothetical protein